MLLSPPFTDDDIEAQISVILLGGITESSGARDLTHRPLWPVRPLTQFVGNSFSLRLAVSLVLMSQTLNYYRSYCFHEKPSCLLFSLGFSSGSNEIPEIVFLPVGNS